MELENRVTDLRVKTSINPSRFDVAWPRVRAVWQAGWPWSLLWVVMARLRKTTRSPTSRRTPRSSSPAPLMFMVQNDESPCAKKKATSLTQMKAQQVYD